MTGCDICSILKSKTNLIYEDKLAFAFLPLNPAVKGHVVVAPKEHHPILEQTPDNLVSHCFFVSNKASVLAFEGLKVQGTNITVNNGVPAGQTSSHFSINVLPRTEKDGLSFEFKRAQAKPEDLKSTVSSLKECTDLIGYETPKEKVKEEVKEIKEDSDEPNYLLKQMERLP